MKFNLNVFFKIYLEITFVNNIKFPQSPGCFTANSQDFIILFYFIDYAAYEDIIEVCPATEHEEGKLLVEYLERLKLYESNSVAQKMLPDPLEIEKDSWMSESQGIFN